MTRCALRVQIAQESGKRAQAKRLRLVSLDVDGACRAFGQ